MYFAYSLELALVFVYDYHPLSCTLFQKHFSSQTQLSTVPEKVIWSYITQLSSALKTIHSAGLAARVIEPTKILITSRNRVRLNCCGIFDMVNFDGGKNVPHFQVSVFYIDVIFYLHFFIIMKHMFLLKN